MNRRQRLSRLGATLVVAASPIAFLTPKTAAAPSPAPAIFTDAQRPTGAREPLTASDINAVRRTRYVRFDATSIEAAAQPGGSRSVSLPLFEDVTLQSEAEGVEIRPGNLSWRGTIESEGKVIGTTTFSVIGKSLYATLLAGSRLYRVEPVGDGVEAIYELDPGAVNAGAAAGNNDVVEADPLPPSEPPTPLPATNSSSTTAPGASAEGTTADGLAPEGMAAAASGETVDLLVVYTPQAQANAPGGDIVGSVNAAVNDTNNAYANSGIAQRIRLVDVRAVSFTETPTQPGDDLFRLKGSADGFMDAVHSWRDSVAADVVTMWGYGYNSSGTACGVGYVMGSVSASFEAFAFNIVDVTCNSTFTLAHELGHNMSARHDWRVDATNNSPYTYNHGFVSTAGDFNTVMAYSDPSCPGGACSVIPNFSNPEVAYLGRATGLPEGSFQASDNRKTLNNTATTVAYFRTLLSLYGEGPREWVDFNGDGKADYCRRVSDTPSTNRRIQCTVSTGAGFGATYTSGVLDWGYVDESQKWVDFNGDGKADYCRRVGVVNQVASYIRCTISTGTGFGAEYSSGVVDWGYPGPGRTWVDFNGDGKADYCRLVGGGLQTLIACIPSTGVGFGSSVASLPLDWGHADESRKWTDFDGDGKADYCRRTGSNGDVQCTVSLGIGFGPTFYGIGVGWGYGGPGRDWADFNGDDKSDFCRLVGNGPNQVQSYVQCVRSTGTAFDANFTSGVLDWGIVGEIRRWADFNGDQKADYCRAVGVNNLVNSYIRCTTSTGTGFGAEFTSGVIDWGFPAPGRDWADFNGDGKADFCRRAGSNTNPLIRCTVSTGTGFGPDYASGVLDWGY